MNQKQPAAIQRNMDRQREHLARMKGDIAANHEYYEGIMATRYPVYLDLIGKHRQGGRLLDVGAGFADTWAMQYVRPAGFEYCCTDIADEVVEYMEAQLSSQGEGIFAKKGVLEELPWEDDSFDVVYAAYILEHTTDIRQAFAEIMRVLRPGGVLLFAVPCGYDDNRPISITGNTRSGRRISPPTAGTSWSRAASTSITTNSTAWRCPEAALRR